MQTNSRNIFFISMLHVGPDPKPYLVCKYPRLFGGLEVDGEGGGRAAPPRLLRLSGVIINKMTPSKKDP